VIPVLHEPDQPDDFIEIIEEIDFHLLINNLTWHSERVIDYINRLHSVAGYTPVTPEIARYALSYRQLQSLKNKLMGMTKETR
jgi:hypothetical protein